MPCFSTSLGLVDKCSSLDFFLQNLPVLLQPSLPLFHCGSICADNAPKAGRVIGFDEVSKFVDDHVVYYEHRRLDETPIEIDIAVHSAGAPAVPIVNDPGSRKPYTQLTGVLLDAIENLLFGAGDIPIPQHFTTLALMRGGHHEPARKLNLSARCLGNLNSIVPSEVRGGFAVHDFLAGRMRPILIFLRVAKFRQ